MLCLACGEEMRLVQVVKDTTMLVSGYEHHTWQCSGCATVEQRMTFTPEESPSQPLSVEPTPVEAVQAAPAEPAHLRPPTVTVQTNVWFEKLRSLKERAAAAREAAQSR